MAYGQDLRAGFLASDFIDLGHGAAIVLIWAKAEGNAVLEFHSV